MAFALVYGAEHYVVDVLAGWVYAYVVWAVLERRRARVPAAVLSPTD